MDKNSFDIEAIEKRLEAIKTLDPETTSIPTLKIIFEHYVNDVSALLSFIKNNTAWSGEAQKHILEMQESNKKLSSERDILMRALKFSLGALPCDCCKNYKYGKSCDKSATCYHFNDKEWEFDFERFSGKKASDE